MAFSRLLQSLCIFFLSVSVLATSANAATLTCKDLFATETAQAPTFHLYVASQTLSQVVRDNAPDYWYWVKRNGAKYFTAKMLKQEGIVPGDTHPGNFILAPLGGQIRFFLSDFKDGGRAPFVLDFARLVMSTQAIYRRVDERPRLPVTLDAMFDSYIAGLKGKQQDPPEALSDLFEMSMSDYEKLASEYIDKKTAYHRFRLKNGKVAPFSVEETGLSQAALDKTKADMVTAVLKTRPNAEILDFAVRPRDRGGSKSADRYWVLVKTGNKEDIVEFKERTEPAVAQYETQDGFETLFYDLAKHYWDVNDKLTRPVQLDGRWFVERPKKVEIFSVPYNPETDKRQDKLLDIATYDANYDGLKHGAQLHTKEFVKFLEKNRKQIIEGVRRLTKDYLDRVEARMESRP